MGSISTHLQTFWAGDPVQFGGVSFNVVFCQAITRLRNVINSSVIIELESILDFFLDNSMFLIILI